MQPTPHPKPQTSENTCLPPRYLSDPRQTAEHDPTSTRCSRAPAELGRREPAARSPQGGLRSSGSRRRDPDRHAAAKPRKWGSLHSRDQRDPPAAQRQGLGAGGADRQPQVPGRCGGWAGRRAPQTSLRGCARACGAAALTGGCGRRRGSAGAAAVIQEAPPGSARSGRHGPGGPGRSLGGARPPGAGRGLRADVVGARGGRLGARGSFRALPPAGLPAGSGGRGGGGGAAVHRAEPRPRSRARSRPGAHRCGDKG